MSDVPVTTDNDDDRPRDQPVPQPPASAAAGTIDLTDAAPAAPSVRGASPADYVSAPRPAPPAPGDWAALMRAGSPPAPSPALAAPSAAAAPIAPEPAAATPDAAAPLDEASAVTTPVAGARSAVATPDAAGEVDEAGAAAATPLADETGDAAADPEATGDAAPPSRLRRTGRSLRRHKWVALPVAAVVIAAAVVLPITLRSGGLPSGAAFRYDGHVTSGAQLDDEVRLLEALYGITPPATTSKDYDTFRRDAAKSFAVSQIVDTAIKQHKIVIADKTVSDSLAAFVKQNYPQGQQSFVDALAQQGVNQQQVSDEIRRQLSIQRLYDQVTAKVTVSDAQVQAKYNANPALYVEPAQRDIKEIVVASQADADAVMHQLHTGADFATLAKAQSLDQSTNSSGGDLGTLAESQLDATFGKAAFAAKVGAFFGPVKDNNNYYVGQVVSQTAPKQLALTDVQSALHDQMVAAAGLQVWQTFLGDAITAAHVQYAAVYRPADPDAPPSDTSALNAATGTVPSAAPSVASTP